MATRHPKTKGNKGQHDKAVDALSALIAEIETTDNGRQAWTPDEIAVLEACEAKEFTYVRIAEFVNRVPNTPTRSWKSVKGKIQRRLHEEQQR